VCFVAETLHGLHLPARLAKIASTKCSNVLLMMRPDTSQRRKSTADLPPVILLMKNF